MSSTSTNDVIDTVGQWFDKFPALPKNWREFLVRIIPYLALIFGLLGIISILSWHGYGILAVLIYLIASILLLASYPGVSKRKYKGWKLLFLSEVVNLIGGLVSLVSILWVIIGALIGFYLLFQIRSYYK
jgi:hypothetical protein